MNFEQLDTAIQPDMILDADDVAFADESLDDAAALAIVVGDTNRAEAFRSSKLIDAEMDRADELYRAVVKKRTWADGSPRASLSSFTILEAIEKILPVLHSTLWGGRGLPCEIAPIGKTTQAAATAKSHLLRWAFKQSRFKEHTRRALKSCLTYGFCISQYGWQTATKKIKKWKRDDQGKIVPDPQDQVINQPFFKSLNLRRVLFDPAADTQDLGESAGWVVLQMSIKADELDSLRKDPAYKNVPTRDELRLILATNNATGDSLASQKQRFWSDLQAERDFTITSTDPMAAPLELLEYWSDDRVITVLNRCIVIRNESNEFGKKPFPSCAFIDVIGSAWGFGVAKLLSGEQNFIAGVRNMWVDSQALQLTPMFQTPKGAGAGSQNIKVQPGRVLTSQAGPLTRVEIGSITTEALTAISDTESRAYRLVGANSGANLPSQAMRTAEGINAFASDVSSRMQYFLDQFCELVFVPAIEAMLDMCTDHLTPAQINDILSEADGKAYQGDILDVYNASCAIEVNAGTKLSQRIAASNLIPQIIALVTNAAVQQALIVQNKKFDFEGLLEQALPLMGLELDALLQEMTPEDQQRAQANNPQFVRGQQDQQLEDQKHANAKDLLSEKGFVQASVGIIKTAVKEHTLDPSSAMGMMQPGSGQPTPQAPPMQGTQ